VSVELVATFPVKEGGVNPVTVLLTVCSVAPIPTFQTSTVAPFLKARAVPVLVAVAAPEIITAGPAAYETTVVETGIPVPVTDWPAIIAGLTAVRIRLESPLVVQLDAVVVENVRATPVPVAVAAMDRVTVVPARAVITVPPVMPVPLTLCPTASSAADATVTVWLALVVLPVVIAE